MDLKRFFSANSINDSEVVILTGDEFYHAVKVCRLKEGFKFIACDNSGYDYYCEVSSISKDKLTGRVEKAVYNETNNEADITLFIGANKEIDKIVQKAVEIGVKTLVPFTSQHTNVSTVNKERLNKIVLESSKQCGRATLMEVRTLTTFNELILSAEKSDKLFFYEQERNKKVNSVLTDKSKSIALIIGGEGGFSESEAQSAIDNGWNSVTLGPRILRVETAVVSALTLILQGAGRI